jgi:hypothetical protein
MGRVPTQTAARVNLGRPGAAPIQRRLPSMNPGGGRRTQQWPGGDSSEVHNPIFHLMAAAIWVLGVVLDREGKAGPVKSFFFFP